ncbi:MAG TPA: hypothetical protein VFL72_05520 [Acidimicrobiia bacterium]|nr:hypothetical protein [Acidimicrobiia bacterium]
MAKSGGMGDNFYIDGYDLSGDVNSLSKVGGGMATFDMTGIDKFAFERQGGLKDGEISFTTYMNDSVGQATAVLNDLPTADVSAAYFRGTTQGNQAACLVAKQINFDPTRANDGMITFQVQALANGYGLEWGNMLTAGKRTDTSATSPATGYDFLAASSFGWQAYLQVFSFTGTSCTVTLEDSANNSAFAVFTSSAFAAATARGTQRIAGAAGSTVRRYVRAVTSGTFSECTFAVVFVKNESAVAF